MKKILKKFLRNKLEDYYRGRNIEIFKDDIFLVSYPKSGNTWMRFLIGNYLYEEFSFKNMEELIPDIYVVSNKQLKSFPRPRILKSHEYFHPSYNKVIYIVRDPRSVAVSYYYFCKKIKVISDEVKFDEYFEKFINGKLDHYGTWEQNVLSWYCVYKNHNKKFLLVKYEDLKKNTFSEFKRILTFLNFDIDEDKIRKAIEYSSFYKMKEKEKKEAKKTKVLKKTRSDIPFVRSGKMDEWKEYFNQEMLNKLYYNWGDTMKELGYIND